MSLTDRGWLRLLDANLNRLREGVRVAEEICRFVFDDANLARSLKELRHNARTVLYDECLQSRDSDEDVLRPTLSIETDRADIKAVLIANFKRAQESARTLEEILKLHNTQEAEKFKSIRYALYTLEKSVVLGSCKQ